MSSIRALHAPILVLLCLGYAFAQPHTCEADATAPECSSSETIPDTSDATSAPEDDANIFSEAAPFIAELTSASRLAVEASVLALGAWGRVLYLVSQPIKRLAVAAWPSVKAAAATAAAAAAAQPKKAIAIELVAVLVLIACWRLGRFVARRRYFSRARDALRRRRERIVASVARRSRVLAAALPHLGYMLACVACSRVAERFGLRPRWLAFLNSAEPTLATGLPAARTLLAIGGAAEEQQRCLRYWVVWAGAYLCTGLLEEVPFAARVAQMGLPLLRRYPILHELPFYAWLWLQLPGGGGLQLAYDAVAPGMRRRSEAAAALLPSPPARLTGALNMVLAYAIGFERRDALAEAVNDGGILISGCFFLLTPSPIAAVGLLLLALGGPMLRSIDALAASAVTPATAAQLRYWLTYAAFCGARRVLLPALRWVPFMTHWQLLAVLWLQLPFFRTLTRLLSHLIPPILRQVVGAPAAAEVEEISESSRPNATYSARLTRSTGSSGGRRNSTTPDRPGSAREARTPPH